MSRTVQEAVAQVTQGLVLADDGVFEDAAPEETDVLRSLALQAIQQLVNASLQFFLTRHAIQLLHVEMKQTNGVTENNTENKVKAQIQNICFIFVAKQRTCDQNKSPNIVYQLLGAIFKSNERVRGWKWLARHRVSPGICPLG